MSAISQSPVVDLQLWSRFNSGLCTESEIADNVMLRRWARCRDAGLSADNPGEPVIQLAGMAAALDRFAPVLAPGSPFDAFASMIASIGYCGLLADENGMILSRSIAEPFENAVADAALVEGAVWSEMTRGTNGIGTTLTEGTSVSVVGPEHFELRNHGLACYAAPIRDVRTRIVAAIDASGPASMASGPIHASVVATAAAIEALLVARSYDAAVPGGLFELERLMARLPHAVVLVETRGHIRRANARFRSLLPPLLHSEWVRQVRARLTSTGTPSSRLTSATFQDLPSSVGGLSVEVEPIGHEADPIAALVHLRPRHDRRRRAASPAIPEAFATIVGSDPVLAAARDQAIRFARTSLPVLLLGETGAGKEVFARAIHAGSTRSNRPFVAVNCGALAGSLLESELYGYGPGAFTGAAPGGRSGKLTAAHGGTLFLDEVGEMSAPAQAALLRFLEDGTFYRVGEHFEQHADVRLVVATSRDLPSLVTAGRFREDLYFRMRGVVLRLPALRDRNDRRELVDALLARIARARGLAVPLGISPAAMAWIDQHEWRGNVRELRSALEYASVLAEDAPRIEYWHLPIEEEPQPADHGRLRVSAERAAVLRALNQARGNLSDAARSLGVARSTLYRMLERHGLRENVAAE